MCDLRGMSRMNSAFLLRWGGFSPLKQLVNRSTLTPTRSFISQFTSRLGFRCSISHSSLPRACAGVTRSRTPGAEVSPNHSISPECHTLLEDTIFALSTGAGVTAGVAVIRVSGPRATQCLLQLLGSPDAKLPRPRYASVRKLYDPETAELLDEGIVLFFPGPRSFTGEDVVEFHVHGSRAVINGVIEALGKMQTDAVVRPAERGEFTRRAFENGRMDLTSVEGLADLIAAETSMQRKQALRHLSGDVREKLESWREEIKTCLAHAEAVIDFGDDVDDDTFEDILPRIRALRDEINGHVHDRHRGEIVRGGARVVIVGEPNAGKSTLLNALARRPAAIVSPKAGTTRDVVEVQLDLNGLAVVISDTAGLRDKTDDPIEVEGMRRTRAAASEADVTVLVHDGSQGGLKAALDALPARLSHQDGDPGERGTNSESVFCVLNKMDLLPSDNVAVDSLPVPVFKTCLLRNEGLSDIISHLENVLRRRVEDQNGLSQQSEGGRSSYSAPIITRARHRYHLELTLQALNSFIEGRTGPNRVTYLPMDLAAEELRIAGKELGSITGIIHAEELLDLIFSEFCIGK